MEIPKYSEWVQKISGKTEIEIDTESFKALFSKRDERTPNKQMHNFLKAYAFAVNNARKEDRFPNLDEIEKAFTDVGAPIEGQVVYNLKLRFMKNTQFFEERDFGTKGVYLSPKALRFKDRGGRYSDLIFDFDNGAVALPESKPHDVDSQKEPKSDIQKVVNETKLDHEGIDKQIGEPKIELEKSHRKSVLKVGLIVLILIIFAFLIIAPRDKYAPKGENVMYSIYDSKDEGGDFLIVELSNPDGVSLNSLIVLPKEIDKIISVEGGTVSIAHSSVTTIGLSTDKDARIKIYTVAIENIPLAITHKFKGNAVPSIYGINNYTVMAIKDKVQLNFEFKKSSSIQIKIEQ